MVIDIADLDCVYLSYNEPQKEEFWVKIQNIVPWAVRVDGVKGSDAAHKAAADASQTDRFILIDGDTLPDPEFFNLQLDIPLRLENGVFRWKSLNYINGLRYGNGGMSCWTKEFAYNMRTHEASDGSDETNVEFCFDPNYHAMHDCYSTTYPNYSPEQAWRAGFREGVKMCLNRGKKPSLDEFEKNVVSRNYDHLCIWMSVGADVENGEWAKAGAILGTYLTMIGDENDDFSAKDWDYTQVQDFGFLERLWASVKGLDPASINYFYGGLLVRRLSLPITDLGRDGSAFFKRHYRSDFHNLGPMVTEMDVIRRIEGW